MARLAVLILCGLTLAPAAGAETLPIRFPGGLVQGGAGQVVAVADGDTLTLEDGSVVRLVGIQAPKLALGRRRQQQPWPLAQEARDALATLVQDRRVRLFFGGRKVDRYGRWLAHVARDDGLWVQGAMLARGLARVYTFADNRAAAPEMLAIERAARAQGLGIWAHPYYRVRAAPRADAAVGGFHLIEGVVRRASTVRGRLYVNFGDDWKRDFTILIEPRALRSFAWPWRDPAELAGRVLRVRGWVKRWNGAMIEVDHPEQIEFPERKAAGPAPSPEAGR